MAFRIRSAPHWWAWRDRSSRWDDDSRGTIQNILPRLLEMEREYSEEDVQCCVMWSLCRGFIHNDFPFRAESCKAQLTPYFDPFRLQGLKAATNSMHRCSVLSLCLMPSSLLDPHGFLFPVFNWPHIMLIWVFTLTLPVKIIIFVCFIEGILNRMLFHTINQMISLSYVCF